MKGPRLSRLTPETTGFNRARIAAAAVVAAVTLGLVTFVLTRGGGEGTGAVEPAIPASRPPEPRELLEDETPPPGAGPPPMLEPDLGRLFEAPQEPAAPAERPSQDVPAAKPPQRVERAFSQPVRTLRGGGAARAGVPARRGERPTPSGSLESMFEALEAQSGELERMLEHPLLLPGTGSAAAGPAAAPPPRGTRPLEVDLERPRGRWRLSQGTVIPAQLVSEINSDLPGQVVAQVVRDVFDSGSFEHLLVPRGTRLLGRYDSGLRTGQNRLAIEWSRLLLPNGSSIEVEAQPAVDAQGRSGLRDRVNHHTGRVFGNALLLSLVSAGFAAAQPSGDAVRLSAGDLAVEAASEELERAASELLRRSASIPPTVRIRSGTALGVMLTRDLTFPAPYSH